MKETNSRNMWIDVVICCLIVMGCIITFRNVIFNDNLIGSAFDGRLNCYFAEHWYRVFCGQESWKELLIFYPEENVISYSDIMLGFSFPYSFFRLFGISIGTSFKYAVILVYISGSLILYGFMRFCLHCKPVSSLFTVVVFSFASSYVRISGNPQLYAESIIPLILLLIFAFARNRRKISGLVYGTIATALFVLLFYTSFYVAFFSIVFAMICCLIALPFCLYYRKNTYIRRFLKELASLWKSYLLFAAEALVLLFPLVGIYLPTLESHGGRDWDVVVSFSLKWNGLLLFDNFDFFGERNLDSYVDFGIPAIEVAILIFLACFGLCNCVRENGRDGWKTLLLRYMIIVMLVSLLLVVIVPVGGGKYYSLWYIIYKLVPGASAIRAVVRWQTFILLPLGICATFFLEEFMIDKHMGIALLLSLIAFLCNFVPAGINTEWCDSVERDFLNSVKAPPEDCEVMFLVDSQDTRKERDEVLQMDAWAIADRFGLKTINGYSGQTPNEWDIYVHDADVDRAVIAWLSSKNVQGTKIYAYDISTNQWTQLNY